MIIRSLFTCCRSSGLLRVSKLIDNALDLQLRSFYSGGRGRDNLKRLSAIYYCAALSVFMLGFSYAGVPLYRIYCAKTGGGTNSEGARAKSDRVEKMKPVRDRKITVEFSADTYSRMAWNFKPAQKSVTIVPGKLRLPSIRRRIPQTGQLRASQLIQLYLLMQPSTSIKSNVSAFEEQRLNPQEEVDLPVFFFLDPEFDDDPRLMRVTNIILHYTFFEAKKEKLMIPGISTPVLEEPSVT